MAWSVILVWTILLIILAVVLVIFIRSPDEQKFNWFTPAHRPGVEYAPEYSVKEKLLKLGLHGLWLVPLFLVMNYGVFPVLREPSKWLCQNWFGIPSARMMPVLLCGFSITLIWIACVPVWRHWWNVLKLEQHPLPGQKVFKPTPIIRNRQARQRARLVLFGMPVSLMVMTGLLVMLAFRLGDLITTERIKGYCAQTTQAIAPE